MNFSANREQKRFVEDPLTEWEITRSYTEVPPKVYCISKT